MTVGNLLVRNHNALAKACLGGGFAFGSTRIPTTRARRPSRRRLGGGCVSASKSIPAVFFAHRVVARVWPPVARFSPRLAPRALRTRAFPTPAAPKESAFATEITNTHLTFGYRARFAALLLTRPQASRTKNSRPRSRYERAARTRHHVTRSRTRRARRGVATPARSRRRGFDVESLFPRQLGPARFREIIGSDVPRCRHRSIDCVTKDHLYAVRQGCALGERCGRRTPTSVNTEYQRDYDENKPRHAVLFVSTYIPCRYVVFDMKARARSLRRWSAPNLPAKFVSRRFKRMGPHHLVHAPPRRTPRRSHPSSPTTATTRARSRLRKPPAAPPASEPRAQKILKHVMPGPYTIKLVWYPNGLMKRRRRGEMTAVADAHNVSRACAASAAIRARTSAPPPRCSSPRC